MNYGDFDYDNWQRFSYGVMGDHHLNSFNQTTGPYYFGFGERRKSI